MCIRDRMSTNYTPSTEKKLALLYAEADQLDEGTQIVATEAHDELRLKRIDQAIEMLIAADGKKVLWLPINRKWFDMIGAGIKKEEYRDVSEHWDSRVLEEPDKDVPMIVRNAMRSYKKIDIVRLVNGYQRFAPVIDMECRGIRMGTGKPEWGAPQHLVYIITVGKKLNSWNVK